MIIPRVRMASLAVLMMAAALALSACRSRERMADRRAEAGAAGSAAIGESDDSFFADGAVDDAGVSAKAAVEDEVDTAPSVAEDEDLALLGDDDDDDVDFSDLASGDDDDDDIGGSGDSEASRVLKDMRRDNEVNVETAKWWAAKGDDAFRQSAYKDAANAYRKSLDLNHTDAVNKRWNETLLLLGDRDAESVAIPDQEFGALRVADEQTKEEIKRNLAKAKKSFEAGDLSDARRAARVAIGMIKANMRLVDEGDADKADKLLRDIELRQVEVEKNAHLERIASTEAEIQRELHDEDVRRKNQVQDLLFKARRHIRLKEYRKAQEACESVIQIEPSNRVATYWRKVSRDQINNLQRLQLRLDREQSRKLADLKFIDLATPFGGIEFPTDQNWQKVVDRSKRARGTILEEPESIKIIRNRLESHVITDINFEETPLTEVVETFRQIANVNMILASQIDGEADEFKVTQQITNLSAASALRLILESKNLGSTFEDNAMIISSKDDLRIPTVFDVYNVQDLLTKIRDFQAPEIRLKGAGEGQAGESPISFTADSVEEQESLDPDTLVELIKDTSGGEEIWLEDFSIDVSRGQLFVDAPPGLHIDVQRVLDSLRQDSDLFVIIEARFIDVFDDFLEDIGVDSRSLGLVNNRGNAFGNVINNSRTGGNDLGIVQQGDQEDVFLVQGLDRWAGRVQHIIDGFSGTVRGDRLSAGNGLSGGTFQATWLEPFQVNVILRMVQEKQDVRQLTAPVVTAHNNERVYVSVITQRAYIADYELVSGGTGFSIIEVADPVIQTFQEGVILDVDPTISHDKKYVTLDVRPTLATLIGGVISTINISLGSFTNVAFQVPIGIPQIALQQSFTSVTVPNGGTVLLGGFKSMDQGEFVSYLPILGHIPILKNLARRKATISEKRSLVILLSARIVDLRGQEAKQFNRND